jgi:hypothetical protein
MMFFLSRILWRPCTKRDFSLSPVKKGTVYNVAKAGALQNRGVKGEAVVLLLRTLDNKGSGVLLLSRRGETWRKQTWRHECTGGCISVVTQF